MAKLSDKAQFSKSQLQQIRMVFNEGIDELVLTQFDELRDEMNTRFDGVNTRFDGVNTRFDGVNTRFDGVTSEIRSISARLDIIEHDLATIKDGHVRLFKQVQDIDDRQAEPIDEIRLIRKKLFRDIPAKELEELKKKVFSIEKELGLV